MDHLNRVVQFFEWTEAQARPVVAEMLNSVGGQDALDALSPGEFASLACRIAASMSRRAEGRRPRAAMADRADNMIRLIDKIARMPEGIARRIAASECSEIAADMVGRDAPPVLLVRRGLAMVPTMAGGLIRLRPVPVRLLDVESLDEIEDRVLLAASIWMAGDRPSLPQLADLQGAVCDLTDATRAESRAVVELLGGLSDQEAPGDLLEFAELVTTLLDSVRRPATFARRNEDVEPWLVASLDRTGDE